MGRFWPFRTRAWQAMALPFDCYVALLHVCRCFLVHSGGALLDKQLHPHVDSRLGLNHDLERAAQSHLKDGRLVCFAIVQALHTSHKSTCHIKQTCD
jgi:hypothetical protein